MIIKFNSDPIYIIRNYYTTLLKSVQITCKTSTNIQRYLDSWLFVHIYFLRKSNMSVNVEMLKAYIEANTYRFSSFFRQKYFPFSKKIKMVHKIKLKFDEHMFQPITFVVAKS